MVKAIAVKTVLVGIGLLVAAAVAKVLKKAGVPIVAAD